MLDIQGSFKQFFDSLFSRSLFFYIDISIADYAGGNTYYATEKTSKRV